MKRDRKTKRGKSFITMTSLLTKFVFIDNNQTTKLPVTDLQCIFKHVYFGIVHK